MYGLKQNSFYNISGDWSFRNNSYLLGEAKQMAIEKTAVVILHSGHSRNNSFLYLLAATQVKWQHVGTPSKPMYGCAMQRAPLRQIN